MKRIDASKEGIFDLSWSPDGKWIAYVLDDNEVRLANAETGEIRVIGPGCFPGLTKDLSVVLERNDELVLVTATGTRTVLGKRDLIKDTPKRRPSLSPSGSSVVAAVCNVFDKESQSRNAYPHRHFLAVMSLAGGGPTLTSEQWYGGTTVWFPGEKLFAHFEFDSTGGPRVHVLEAGGKRLGTMAGLYPSVSPDGDRIAVRPRGGGTVVVYKSKNGTWSDDDIETSVVRIPSPSDSRLSATPPIWIDTRFVLVEEGGTVWRLDIKRDKAEEMKKLPLPTQRRRHSMIASPSRDMLAMEVEAEGGFELRLIPLI